MFLKVLKTRKSCLFYKKTNQLLSSRLAMTDLSLAMETVALHTSAPPLCWEGGPGRHLAPPITPSATFQLPSGRERTLEPLSLSVCRGRGARRACLWEVREPLQVSPGDAPGQAGELHLLPPLQLGDGGGPRGAAEAEARRPRGGW